MHQHNYELDCNNMEIMVAFKQMWRFRQHNLGFLTYTQNMYQYDCNVLNCMHS